MDCVVILNWKAANTTIRCLESILNLGCTNLMIVICDNASKDGSVNDIYKWLSGNVELYGISQKSCVSVKESELECMETRADVSVCLIENECNYGYAGGNNVGIKFAVASECELIWILNNDTEVAANAYLSAKSAFEKNPKLGLAGSVLVDMGSKDTVQAYGGRINKITFTTTPLGRGLSYKDICRSQKSMLVDYVIGASMFMRAEMLREFGLLSEEYFLYFEEVDYCRRIESSDWGVEVVRDSLVYHELGGSTDGGRSDLAQKLYIRNRAVFCKKYYPHRYKYFLLTLPLVCVKNIVRGRINVAGFSLAVLFSAMRGGHVSVESIKKG